MHTISLNKNPRKRKGKCPLCGHSTLTTYINNTTGMLFPNHVGRCDRENNCGYHYTPKEFFSENGVEESKEQKIIAPDPPKAIDYLPIDLVEKSMNGYTMSNFGEYIIRLFGKEHGSELLRRYFVGRSKSDNGKANIFFRIDADGLLCTGKVMAYHPMVGKRNKDIHPTWIHSAFQPFTHKLCFFGEHLISEHPEKTISVCESEKTAIVASFFFPQFVWLATGGASGCKWREYSVFKVFKNRNVILFPDFGYYNRKTKKTCYQEWKERADSIMKRMECNIQVSSVLEKNLLEEQRVNDFDLVDLLVKRDEQTGIALTDDDYPAIWDRL